MVATNAEAHKFAPSLLQVTETAPGQYEVLFKTPAQTLTATPLLPSWPDGCTARPTHSPRTDQTGVSFGWTLICAGLQPGPEGALFGVEGLATNRATAILVISTLSGARYQATLHADETSYRVPEKAQAGGVLGHYLALGAEHIASGPDHLLFILGILLLVRGGRKLFWTITAFTLGHSVTLALATLGWLNYRVDLIEALIAFSVFLLAIELGQEGAGGRLWRRPWWIAGGFGLLHGMGFAGALSDVGLPADHIPLALFSFNLGIEAGQLAFVGIVLVFWRAARPVVGPWAGKLWWLLVYLLGFLSAYWTVERSIAALRAAL